MHRLLYIYLLLFSTLAFSQNKSGVETSDSLYAVGVDLYYSKKYSEAITVFTLSDSIDKVVMDPTSNRRDYSAMWLAHCYRSLGEKKKAESIFHTEDEPPIDRRLTVKSDSLSSVGLDYLSTGEYEKAIDNLLQCAEIEKEVVGEIHSYYVNTLYNIAYCYNSIKKVDIAREYISKAANNYNRIGNRSLKEQAVYMNSISSYCSSLPNPDVVGSIEFMRKSANLIEQDYLCNGYNGNYVIILTNLAVILLNINEYDEALEWAAKACLGAELAGDTISTSYITALDILIEGAISCKKYSEATDHCAKILSIADKVYRKESIQYVQIAHKCYCYQFAFTPDYTSAIKGMSECLDIIEQLNEEDYNLAFHLEVLKSLSTMYGARLDEANRVKCLEKELVLRRANPDLNIDEKLELTYSLASSYVVLCKYEKADSILKSVKNRETELHGEITLLNFKIMNSLSMLHTDKGDYVKAIEYCNAAIDIYKKLNDDTVHDWRYIQAIRRKAIIYSHMGDTYNKNLCIKETLEAASKIPKPKNNSPSIYTYLRILQDRAFVLYQNGEYNEAEHIIKDVVQTHIDRPIYASNNYSSDNQIVGALTLLGKIQVKKGELESAKRSFNEAKKYIRKNTLTYANYLENTSIYSHEASAISQLKEAADVYKEFMGCESEEYLNVMAQMAAMNYRCGNNANALECIAVYMKYFPSMLKRNYSTMTPRERSMFYEKFKPVLEQLFPMIAYYYQHPIIIGEWYNSTLLVKNMLLSTEIEMHNLLGNDIRAKDLYEKLLYTRKKVDNAVNLPASEREAALRNLYGEMNVIERELQKISKEFGDFTSHMNIKWQDVKQALGETDMAVEFVKFPMENDTTGYAALVLKKDYEYPHFIPCVAVIPGSSLMKPGRDIYNETLIAKAVWRKLYTEMTDVKNVYFVPAGELYNIAIESLPDFENPSKRISDRWNFFRLSSTRELVFRKRPKSIESAAVYGGINYSTDTAVIMNNSKQYATTRGGLGFDISNISDTTLLRSGAKYLPATKDEAANIALELKKKGIRYTMYTDSTATEASFKNLTGNNVNLLHIATHGFYCTPQEINKEIEFLFHNNNELQAYEDNALNRSGLLFAGANNTLSGKALSPDIDGILTAKEIGTMDLRNLDLVVLSACQTGLGDVTGEGVFGLQRAFKKAGVNSLLMSLWKVDDTATALFMTRFYKNMMTGMNKRNAFVDAQKYLREYETEIEVVDTQVKAIDRVRNRHKAKNERTYKKVRPYNNPRFWAAFVLLDAIE